MTGTRLAIVGGGKMGEALLAGLLGAQWARAEEIIVVEPIEARRKEVAGELARLEVEVRLQPADSGIYASIARLHRESGNRRGSLGPSRYCAA